jgi:hypothetical protein
MSGINELEETISFVLLHLLSSITRLLGTASYHSTGSDIPMRMEKF